VRRLRQDRALIPVSSLKTLTDGMDRDGPANRESMLFHGRVIGSPSESLTGIVGIRAQPPCQGLCVVILSCEKRTGELSRGSSERGPHDSSAKPVGNAPAGAEDQKWWQAGGALG